MPVSELFVTRFMRDSLTALPDWQELNTELEQACLSIAEDDEAGREWCEQNGYDGYTSYASLDDLHTRAPAFARLKTLLEAHAGAYAEELYWNLRGASLVMDSFWINVLNPLAAHSGHIHPNSVLSGTYYVAIPEGAGALKLEDPRLPFMMNAPPLRKDAPQSMQRFLYQKPEPGTFMLWESWLRHEVTPNLGEDLRISLSFNFSLD